MATSSRKKSNKKKEVISIEERPTIEIVDVIITQQEEVNITPTKQEDTSASLVKTEPEQIPESEPIKTKEEQVPEVREETKEDDKDTSDENSQNNQEEQKESSWDKEDDSPTDKENRSLFGIGIGVLVVIIIITGTLFYFFINSSSRKTTTVNTQKTNITPTVTPMPELNKSEWPLEILNGSGIPGSAAEAAENLEEQGYTILETDNADNQDYEENELYVSEELKDKADLLIKDLEAEYGFTKVTGTLTTDSTAAARIIIGSN